MSAPSTPPALLEARTAELFAPGLRGLTLGIVLTITLAALESLAIGTVMPVVAADLGNIELYGWVYSAFFLGSLLGIVVTGGALDRMPLWRPFAAGLGLFALGLAIGGLAPSMPVLVLARFVQGLGAGSVGPTAYAAIGRCLPERLQPRMFAMMSTAWVVPGIIGPSIAAVVGQRRLAVGLPRAAAAPGPRRRAGLVRTAERAGRDPRDRRPGGGGHGAPSAQRVAGGRGCGRAGGRAHRPATRPAPRRLCARDRHAAPRLQAPDAPGDPGPGRGGACRRSPARRDDVRLLRRGRLHPAPAPDLARDVADADRHRVHRHDPGVDGGDLGAGAADRRLGTAAVHPARVRAHRCRVCADDPPVLPGVPPEIAIITWIPPGIGMGFMYSAVTLVVLRGVAAFEQGSATSALQLSDILGTALGTGVAGAIIAFGQRAGGNGLGFALAGVFALSLIVAVAGALASGRIRTTRPSQGGLTAAVD